MLPHCRSACVVVALFVCFLPLVAPAQERAPDNAATLELKPKHVLKLENRPTSFTFSWDGKRFAANDAGGAGRVWETSQWKQVGEFPQGKSPKGDHYFLHSVTVSPQG